MSDIFWKIKLSRHEKWGTFMTRSLLHAAGGPAAALCYMIHLVGRTCAIRALFVRFVLLGETSYLWTFTGGGRDRISEAPCCISEAEDRLICANSLMKSGAFTLTILPRLCVATHWTDEMNAWLQFTEIRNCNNRNGPKLNSESLTRLWLPKLQLFTPIKKALVVLSNISVEHLLQFTS